MTLERARQRARKFTGNRDAAVLEAQAINARLRPNAPDYFLAVDAGPMFGWIVMSASALAESRAVGLIL